MISFKHISKTFNHVGGLIPTTLYPFVTLSSYVWTYKTRRLWEPTLPHYNVSDLYLYRLTPSALTLLEVTF